MNIGISRLLPQIAAVLVALSAAGGAAAQTVRDTGPSALNGYGTLSVSTSSVALSTLTVGPNSLAWKMPFNGTLYVNNSVSSAGILYVCPQGGTCSSSVGIPIPVGGAYGFNLGGSSTSPTVIAASTATAIPQW